MRRGGSSSSSSGTGSGSGGGSGSTPTPTVNTVSIIPVCNDGTMSVDESTTGWKPAFLHASTDAGSPSQANSLADLA